MAPNVASSLRQPTTRTVAFGSLWNLLGRAGPQLVVLLTTPLMINALGASRWGIFSLALALLGLSGLIDMGLGRALTQGVAERRHAGREAEAADLVKTGLAVLGGLGVAGGLLAAAAAHPLAYHVLSVPSDLRHETETALYVIALTIPFLVINGALWGVMTALNIFRQSNIFGAFVAVGTYAGQLLVLYATDSLAAVLMVTLATRVAVVAVYWKFCRDAMPALAAGKVDRTGLRPLMRMGGWMTVSNIVFPIVTYADRFVIASVLSAAAIGYYATPSDLMGRIHIVTMAVMMSLFPAIAAFHRSDPPRAALLFGRAVITVSIVLFPAALVATAFSNELLTLWVGADYAQHAAPVLRVLAIATLLGAADGIVVTLLDAIGQPRINAQFSLVELVLFIPVLFLMLHLFGFVGGAVAYVVRVAIDFAVRLWLAARFYPAIVTECRRVALTTLSGTALLLPLLACSGLAGRCIAIGVVTACFGLVLYTRSATEADRLRVRATVAGMMPAAWLR